MPGSMLPRRMRALVRYLAALNAARTILWCYAIWYAVVVVRHFDPSPRLWLTSLGLSAIIGTGLVLGMRSSSSGTTRLDRWQVFRLYLMPFCVSSFAALVKGEGYVLVFAPDLLPNVLGAGLIAGFVLGVGRLQRRRVA
jgi:hypothetical protein